MMKHCLRICCFVALLLFSLNCYAAKLSSIAFYYGANPPADELRAFDVAVVDPSQRTIDPAKFNTDYSKIYAYVSVGEARENRNYYSSIDKNWILGENLIWQSKVLDQSNKAWREFFVNEVITPLWKRGYKGFFLDTLDSYQLVAKTDKERRQQENGLIDLVKAIKKKYPQAHLIFNRGFEILPKVYKLVDAVAAESLFSGWKQKEKKYEPVIKENRDWLLKQLTQVKKYNLPIISIDYVNPADRAKAREVAKKIENLGFIPWVTDGGLASLGVGSVEVIPRKILALYDGSRLKAADEYPNVLNYAAMPLEYSGYRMVLHDVTQGQLPLGIFKGRYAGILVWVDTQYLSTSNKLQSWLIKQKQTGIPIVILGGITRTISKKFQENFGLDIGISNKVVHKIEIVKQSPIIGYEIKPLLNVYSFMPIVSKQSRVLLKLRDDYDQAGDMVALTNWGGYALSPFVIVGLPNDQVRWVINPLKFFPQALKLQLSLKPDTTTENGRRLFMVHVDGDGFVSRAEWKMQWLAGEAMLREIFSRYKIPITVSIIQGEIAPNGLYPKLSQEAESIAREIFRLPWVEIASHSYSHPFLWPHAEKRFQEQLKKQDMWHLPLLGYKLNLNAEITGSVDYINHELAPKGKRCKVFLWTGACDPDVRALALTYKDGLLNMNGGGGQRIVTKMLNSLTNIPPLGVYQKKYFQTFAPNQNENIYTNEWRGPFYGYRRAIETFELTNAPLRFKPIDIYFHFYSASKSASLKALKEVFNWALTQPTMNIYASDYIRKVLDFNHMVIAKKQDGWLVISNGDLRELRIPQSLGYPDLQRSKNVIGFSSYGKDYYVHLGSAKQSFIKFTQKKPSQTYIKYANGSIKSFKRNKNNLEFTIKSYMPLKFALANMGGCRLYRNRGYIMVGKKDGDAQVFTAKANVLHKFELICRW